MKKEDIPYYRVAKEALMKWNGLTEEQANEFIEKSDFEEIESQIGARNSMIYAIEELAKIIGLNEEEKQEFSKEIFGEVENQTIIEKAKNIQDTNRDANKEVLDMLRAVHDGWVKDNGHKFFARDKKIQHLPLEFIGWKEVKSDLLFVKPIAEAVGINVDEKQLEKAYDERVEKFKSDRKIKTNNDLRREIVQSAHFYPALAGQEDILNVLSNKAYISTFVLKENIQDVLKENSFVFDLSNPEITDDMYEFALSFNLLSMFADNSYHLSTEDKKQVIKNAREVQKAYILVENKLYDEVYEEVPAGKYETRTVLKENQKSTDSGVSYRDIVDRVNSITDYDRIYGSINFSNAEEIVKNEKMDKKIRESLEKLEPVDEKEERRNELKKLVTEFGLQRLTDYLSDDDLEIITELRDEEIDRNEDIIKEKEDKIDVLTRRQQLMEKIQKQEGRLKEQERKIESLDYEIKNLEARQGRK